MIEGSRITSEEDVRTYIHDGSEQQFALHLLRKFPDRAVVFEPRMFSTRASRRAARRRRIATKPDFQLQDPATGEGPYYEITRSARTEHRDPKRRQRNIMKRAAPDAEYHVLYREDLERLQEEDPQFDPFAEPLPPLPLTDIIFQA